MINERSIMLDKWCFQQMDDEIDFLKWLRRMSRQMKHPRFGKDRRITIATPQNIVALSDLTRDSIEQSLAQCRTNKEAAAMLGIDPATLYRKRVQYGLERRSYG